MFHNLSWITEIDEFFHDIQIYWDAPVYIDIDHYRVTKEFRVHSEFVAESSLLIVLKLGFSLFDSDCLDSDLHNTEDQKPITKQYFLI